MLVRTSLITLIVALVIVPSAQAAGLINQWSERLDGAGVAGAAIDSNANIFVCGSGPFVSKYDSNGNLLFRNDYAPTLGGGARGVGVDGLGNIYLAGFYFGDIDFGGGTLSSVASLPDIFLVKLDSNGNHVWSKSFGGPDPDECYAMDVDTAGNVLFTGFYTDTIDFGGGPLPATGADVYVVKYDAAGNHVWSQNFGPSAFGYGIAFDGSGNVLLTGSATAIDFGGGTLSGSGEFVVKFTTAGAHVWSRRSGATVGQAIDADGAGNVLVTGHFSGGVDFGGGTLTSAGSSDIFVLKLDAAGNHVWSASYGDVSSDAGQGIAADDAGNVFVTGSFAGSVDFGGGALASAGALDVFVAHYDVAGGHHWSLAAGDISTDSGRAIAANNEGGAAAAGGFSTSIDFGTGTLSPTGNFLANFVAPEAPINSITDVANDQGRRVRINLDASGLDELVSPTPILQYEAFRRIDALPSSSGFASSRSNDGAVRDARERGMISEAMVLTEGWEFVDAIPAHGEIEYNMVVETLADSTISNGMHCSTFFIRAATASPVVFYDSSPDSGYSVDNLDPNVPMALVAAYNTGSGNQLAWDPPTDPDFQYFRIYRDVTPGFIPGPLNLVAGVASPGWTDSDYDGGAVYYKVTAVDFSGNESDPASPGTATGIPSASPRTFALYQNHPNPFNPATRIQYDVPESGGHVTLRVFDASGRMVKELVATYQPPGRKTALWDGTNSDGRPVSTGAYFYRLSAPDFEMTRKMVLLK